MSVNKKGTSPSEQDTLSSDIENNNLQLGDGEDEIWQPESYGYSMLEDNNQDQDENSKSDLDRGNFFERGDTAPTGLTVDGPMSIKVEKKDRMEPEKVDLIKSIMKNIKIPHNAYPRWAKAVPEEAWLPKISAEDKAQENQANESLSTSTSADAVPKDATRITDNTELNNS
ncbi:hypothetical protein H4219_004421 [Mycoemilia scoparia]|uniref:Male-enhanced antigen 1 n=1 Tax=Mycoemilia scoparia TaxID=417184 RepID=A0A9W8A198_9FUNG|nr:hypothetical protein H4219_004421 [Mycoemilia scoparia]